MNYKIPLKKSWNKSLVAGLKLAAKEIEKSNLPSDIVVFDVERWEDMEEFKSHGYVGYSIVAKDNKPIKDNSFYIDFILIKNTGDESWFEDKKYFKILNNELNKYLDNMVDNYILDHCKYESEVSDREDEDMLLILRAYFVGKPPQT